MASVEVDYAAVQERRERVVETLTGGVAALFKKNDIELIEGDATLNSDGGRGQVNGRRSPPRR